MVLPNRPLLQEGAELLSPTRPQHLQEKGRHLAHDRPAANVPGKALVPDGKKQSQAPAARRSQHSAPATKDATMQPSTYSWP